MPYTRKQKQRGAGFFDFFTSKTNNTSMTNLKSKRNYNVAHSKSRVSNVLASPGQFKYTNKEAIQARYEKAFQQLQRVEKPKETFSALQTISASLDSAIQSQAARETGAVVITIPVGVAQLVLKALRLFISVLVIVFIDLPLGVMSGSPAVNVAAAVAPNTRFNTTANAYRRAKLLTGATKLNVVNYP
jgi:hypothetical protein